MSGVLAHVSVPPGCTFCGGAVVVAPATLLMPLLTFVKFLVTAPPAMVVAAAFLVVAVVGFAVVTLAALVTVALGAVDAVSPTAVVLVCSVVAVVLVGLTDFLVPPPPQAAATNPMATMVAASPPCLLERRCADPIPDMAPPVPPGWQPSLSPAPSYDPFPNAARMR